MGRQLLVCAVACFLLSGFRGQCQVLDQANGDRTGARINAASQELLNSIYIDSRNTAEATPNNTEVKKNSEIPVGDINTQIVDSKTNEEITEGENKDTSFILIAKPAGAAHDKTTDKHNGHYKDATEELLTPSMEDEIDTLISRYAEMISVDPGQMNNFSLFMFIDKWYGTRYKWGGCDNSGIDCSAFSQKLYHDIYSVDILRTARQQHRHCERVKHLEEASEGDLVFFRMHRFRISHVGIYLANGYFVHASSSHGVVISNLNDKYWNRRYAGCGRIEREDKSISESDYMP